MGRAPCCDKTTVKRGPWSREEDALLKNFIEAYGTGGNWIALPRKAGLNRCGKSCRLRWLNYLRPNIRHGGFTEEEDQIICALFSVLGSRWSVIASKLHGRTDNDVKNYWNTKLKKKIASGRVPGFQPRSVCTNNNKVDNYPNCTQPVQPNPQPFPAMKPEPESFAYDHGYNFTMASSSITNNGAISSMPYSSAMGMTNNSPWVPGQKRWDPVHEMSGQSELPPSSRSSSIGGGGEEVEEVDMDDFWLKLLVDQSTFFEGSSTSQVVGHEKINGFGSVLDGPFYPSLC